MSGSQLFHKQSALKPHLVRGSGGVAGEVADLRRDVGEELAPMAAITVEEFTNPVAAVAAGLRAAGVPVLAGETVLPAALLAGGKAALAAYGRNVTFTTAGNTPAHAPANAVVTGTDVDGATITETITVPQTATISAGSKIFKTITSIVFPVAQGGDCTVAIGFGTLLGLTKTPKSRAGRVAVIQEVAAGAVVTTGTVDATNRSYSPAAAPDGAKDYAVYYEYDPTV